MPNRAGAFGLGFGLGPPTYLPALLLLLACLTGCDDALTPAPASADTHERIDFPEIALDTSLPIFWPEVAEISDLLSQDRPPHWVLTALREYGPVRPLDSLSSASGKMPLAADGLLVLAQPYPLSPDENVALDRWVHSGGRVLLFADPMLTHGSAYALGDRRRPQEIALLSPILARWRLELQFDDTQPPGERMAPLGQGKLPVHLPGRFVQHGKGGACTLAGDGLVASCRIGRGHVVAVADAAVLEAGGGIESAPRIAGLRLLLEKVAR